MKLFTDRFYRKLELFLPKLEGNDIFDEELYIFIYSEGGKIEVHRMIII
jgi:hypothetical protein